MQSAKCRMVNGGKALRGRRVLFHFAFCISHFAFCISSSSAQSVPEEFRIKRQEVFEFTAKPTVARDGDKVTITFASRGFCDVTVAIEEGSGFAEATRPGRVSDPGTQPRIVRHLASGVLGPNAPAPFAKNALRQTLVWDGKNDQGRYVDNPAACAVRVSLGLAPRFERTLFWSPKKRISNSPPLIQAAPEGVYVFEGKGMDHLRLFSHEGDYLRTIHPLPAGSLAGVKGLARQRMPQTGRELPVKQGFVQSTLLTSGTSSIVAAEFKFGTGVGARAMAVHPAGDSGGASRIALAYVRLNRLAGDGSSGGLPLEGPATSFHTRLGGMGGAWEGDKKIHVGPTSMAFSPDGRSLYLTGYIWKRSRAEGACYHGVYRLDYGSNAEPEVFAGKMTQDGGGTGAGQFDVPTSVAVDAAGRVYVSDYLNDRVQVFAADGAHLKNIDATRPSKVLVHPRTGEIFVCSWPVPGFPYKIGGEETWKFATVAPTVTRLGTFDRPVRGAVQPLPLGKSDRDGLYLVGQVYQVELDGWAEVPTLWAVGRRQEVTIADMHWSPGALNRQVEDPWAEFGVRMLVEQDGQWVVGRDFGSEAQREVVRMTPPDWSCQRLYVDPTSGLLYVGEVVGYYKSFKQLVQIDPDSGRIRLIELPFDAEDLCIDQDGRFYLRTDTIVARYDPTNWREIPWDYGEEREGVTFSGSSHGRRTSLLSALPTPGRRPVCWNMGGMGISPKGLLVVSCCSQDKGEGELAGFRLRFASPPGKAYAPTIFPGRWRWGEVHVWDKHGRLVQQDALAGIRRLDGIHIDDLGHIYVMAHANRVLDGTPYPRRLSGTGMKLRAGASKVTSPSRHAVVPLPDADRPDRPLEIEDGWVDGAEWFYGGVGFGGFNQYAGIIGGGCACWNSRACWDYYGRSFLPELDHYSVAVVDSAGNLILRVGQYGNVDDGKPLVTEGGPANTRAIGGDEVGLFHGAYLAAHSDRRLFIADPGNARILSVRLEYHATETVSLK